MKTILSKALAKGRYVLSEHESKQVIQAAGIPVAREYLARDRKEALERVAEVGFPLVMKACAAGLAHKSDAGMVHVGVGDFAEAQRVFDRLMACGQDLDGVLIQEMVTGKRELVIGLNRDVQFGPCVMFGVGGILTEALGDVSFRLAPLTVSDAAAMLDEIKAGKLLDAFRGEPAVDREVLIHSLVGVGDLAMDNDCIAEIDINPLIVRDGHPVAVDALVVLRDTKPNAHDANRL